MKEKKRKRMKIGMLGMCKTRRGGLADWVRRGHLLLGSFEHGGVAEGVAIAEQSLLQYVDCL